MKTRIVYTPDALNPIGGPITLTASDTTPILGGEVEINGLSAPAAHLAAIASAPDALVVSGPVISGGVTNMLLTGDFPARLPLTEENADPFGGPALAWYAQANTGITQNVVVSSPGASSFQQFTVFFLNNRPTAEDVVALSYADLLVEDNEIELLDSGDTVSAGKGNDSIAGMGGNDALLGGAGRDSLDGGAGGDDLAGNGGADLLSGGRGNDALSGGKGKDRLFGGAGRDSLDGGGQNDRLVGGKGHDVLNGGGGRDSLEGGRGNDELDGGAGADVLNGGPGNDTVFGGGGADTFIIDITNRANATGTTILPDYALGETLTIRRSGEGPSIEDLLETFTTFDDTGATIDLGFRTVILPGLVEDDLPALIDAAGFELI